MEEQYVIELIKDTKKKVEKIDSKIDDLIEAKGEQRGKLDGHATQLALLWLIAFGVVASLVAPYFMKK